MGNHKANWRPHYDNNLIERFRKTHPKTILKIEKRIKEKNPRINDEILRRMINRLILPPVLERPESDDIWGGNDVLQLSQIDENEIDDKID